MKQRETKEDRLYVRLSEKEKGVMEKKARSMGLKVSAYVMTLVYRDNPELRGEKG